MPTTSEHPKSVAPKTGRTPRHCILCGKTLRHSKDILENGDKPYCAACYLEICFPSSSCSGLYINERNSI
jgi:hypothetical protein